MPPDQTDQDKPADAQQAVNADQANPAKDPEPATKADATRPQEAADVSAPGVPALDAAQLLEELIADARRVAAYGQRTGRLTDNNLFYALAAIEAKSPSAPDWEDAAVISLQTALNRAVAAIYPTTIADLRDDSWKPFTRRSSTTVGQLAFVVLSLFLMGVCAYWTVQYNQGADLIRGVQQLQKEDPRATMDSIVRQLLRAKTESQPAAGGTVLVIPDEPYFALIDRLHSYDARFKFYAPPMESFLENNQLIHDRVGRFVTDVGIYISRLPWVSQATAAVQAPPPALPAVYPEYKVCGPEEGSQPVLSQLKPYVPTSSVGKLLAEYVKASFDVMCVEGVRFMPFLLPDYEVFLQKLQQWSNALGLWYLPALYGALGAMLFYMRRILDPTVPDPPLTRILHRVALGAFSGVIITWFWAPNRELAEGFTSIGLTLFTVAFLTGFCVDVLFALLDRLVTVLMDIAKGGPRQNGPVTVPAVVLNTTNPATPPAPAKPPVGKATPTPAPNAPPQADQPLPDGAH